MSNILSYPVKVPQLYYWDVEFEDKTHYSQFDSSGNENLVKDFISEENTFIDPRDGNRKVKTFSNYFSKLEQSHGNVKMFSLLPFTEEQKIKCESRQDMVIVVDKSIQAITKEIPNDMFVTFKKENTVGYGMSAKGDIVGEPSGKLTKFVLVLCNRENPQVQTVYNINFQVEKWELT